MTAVAEENRELIVDPPPGEVRSERRVASPALASKMLREWQYPRQRPLSEARVARYLHLIATGQWRLNVIHVHHVANPLPGEKPTVLTDGQHRLAAISRQERSLEIIILHHYVDSHKDAETDYEFYDPPGSTRSFADVLDATGLLDDTGLNKTTVARSRGTRAESGETAMSTKGPSTMGRLLDEYIAGAQRGQAPPVEELLTRCPVSDQDDLRLALMGAQSLIEYHWATYVSPKTVDDTLAEMMRIRQRKQRLQQAHERLSSR